MRKQRKVAGVGQSRRKLFSFTVDTQTGQVVTVEALDAAGTRRKVSDRQRKTLAREGRERLESVVEEAFEAGIDCVLGDSDEKLETPDRERDAQLRHDLVAPLIQHSPVGRRLKREVLERAVLGTMLQNSINPVGHTLRTP
jgi:hypothetical protein